ncbi:hypothetical protein LCGC14_0630740 [marine sediment metagenome]|uniref:CMP/dCMP-type deaminase domain-containing protein n=1 Tax=marine sediment metagenome TaxID=412755 RepID=A0A0F9RLI1_9ZZZZ
MRPNWDQYFLMLAHVVATRATCDRKHVGAVIVDPDHRIVATGYNGSAAGMEHCDDAGHELKEIDGRMSCVRTLHAESNALDYAGGRAKCCTLYCTVIPCYDCAKRIVNAGIARVVYAEYYESRNTQLVADYFRGSSTGLWHMPLRFEMRLPLLCIRAGCSNEGRYDSGFCGLHDIAENDGRGTKHGG